MSWEVTQLGQLTPSDILDHMTSCSAYKSEGRRRNRGNVQSYSVWLPKSPLPWWSLAFLEVAEHLPVLGKCEWIPCLALIAPVAFAFCIKLLLSQSMRFFFLPFWFGSFVPLSGVRRQLCGALQSSIMLRSYVMQECSCRGKNNKIISGCN